MNTRSLHVLAVAALLSVPLAAARPSDWPTTMGDAGRTGAPGDPVGGGGAWTFRLGPAHGGLGVGPSVHEGLVFLAGGDVVAVRETDGTEAWRQRIPDVGFASSVAISEGHVVASGVRASAPVQTHTVVALDERTGRVLWTLDLPGPEGPTTHSHASPAIADGLVIAPLFDGLAAIRLDGGGLAWRVDDGALAGAPSAADGRIIYGDGSGTVRARDLDGRLLWSVPLPHRVVAAPLLVNGTAYVLAQTRLHALALDDGERRWEADLPSDTIAPPAWAGDRIVQAAGATILALAPETGARLWTRDLSGAAHHGVAARDGNVVAFDATATLHVLAAGTGGTRRIAQPPLRLPDAHPALDGDRVLLLGLAFDETGASTKELHSFHLTDAPPPKATPLGPLALVALAAAVIASWAGPLSPMPRRDEP